MSKSLLVQFGVSNYQNMWLTFLLLFGPLQLSCSISCYTYKWIASFHWPSSLDPHLKCPLLSAPKKWWQTKLRIDGPKRPSFGLWCSIWFPTCSHQVLHVSLWCPQLNPQFSCIPGVVPVAPCFIPYPLAKVLLL